MTNFCKDVYHSIIRAGHQVVHHQKCSFLSIKGAHLRQCIVKFNSGVVIKYFLIFTFTKQDTFGWSANNFLSVNTDLPLPVGPETIQVNGCASLLSMHRMTRISNIHFYLYTKYQSSNPYLLMCSVRINIYKLTTYSESNLNVFTNND